VRGNSLHHFFVGFDTLDTTSFNSGLRNECRKHVVSEHKLLGFGAHSHFTYVQRHEASEKVVLKEPTHKHSFTHSVRSADAARRGLKTEIQR
jgi:hypothetical protein